MKTLALAFLLAGAAFAQMGPPSIYSSDGKFLGNLSSNPYDLNSTSNPYGRYGSPYSIDSINNPYGQYGSPYSLQSPNNPYAVAPAVVMPSYPVMPLTRIPSMAPGNYPGVLGQPGVFGR